LPDAGDISMEILNFLFMDRKSTAKNIVNKELKYEILLYKIIEYANDFPKIIRKQY